MTATDAKNPKTALRQRSDQLLPVDPGGCGSCRDCNALNADELKALLRHTLRFEAQFDRLANALADLVE
ncbi:MAG: hypothetical protein WBW33_03675 [Bryobacteraceae bacterium]